MATGSPPSDRTRLYVFVTRLMLVLTALAACLVVVLAVTLPRSRPQQQAVGPTPTLFVLPSLTPSDTPTATDTPTRTPLPSVTPSRTPTLTRTPTITRTPRPTSTSTNTPTPTATLTPTPTRTLTPTPSPTRAPYDYVLRGGTVNFRQSLYASTAGIGCNWAGLAGLVYGLSGSPRQGIVVHVTGTNFDRRVTSGSAPAYGPSGWEVSVGNSPSSGVFRVQLEDAGGRLLSDVVSVQMRANCNENLAVLVFDQIQE
jgi:hypothetical protein